MSVYLSVLRVWCTKKKTKFFSGFFPLDYIERKKEDNHDGAEVRWWEESSVPQVGRWWPSLQGWCWRVIKAGEIICPGMKRTQAAAMTSAKPKLKPSTAAAGRWLPHQHHRHPPVLWSDYSVEAAAAAWVWRGVLTSNLTLGLSVAQSIGLLVAMKESRTISTPAHWCRSGETARETNCDTNNQGRQNLHFLSLQEKNKDMYPVLFSYCPNGHSTISILQIVDFITPLPVAGLQVVNYPWSIGASALFVLNLKRVNVN